MALAAPPRVFWEDDEYAVRPAKDNDECREQYWRFMQVLGWNRSVYDLETYLNPSKGRSCGMIVLEQKSTGKLIGQVAAIINKNKTGWVSMFIVEAEFRGRGLGRHLFDAVMKDFERAGTEIIGLDGVQEQVGTYERRGFVLQPGGKVQLMVRDLHEKTPTPGTSSSRIYSGDSGQLPKMIDLDKIPRELLGASDQEYTGFERPDAWSDENLFNRPDVSGYAIITRDPPESTSDIKAWVLVRRSTHGFHIGPLYAKDAESAEDVLAAAVARSKVETIMKIPLPNEPMNDWTKAEITEKGFCVAEVSTWNPQAVAVFERQGWRGTEHHYFRMWLNGKATAEHAEGGPAYTGMYVIADAANG